MKTKFSKGLFVGALLLTNVSGHAWWGATEDGGGFKKQEAEKPATETRDPMLKQTENAQATPLPLATEVAEQKAAAHPEPVNSNVPEPKIPEGFKPLENYPGKPQEAVNVNVPEDVQAQVKEEMKNSLASIGFPMEDEEENETDYFAYDPDRKPQNVAEAMAMVSAKISESISKSSFNYKWEPPPPYIPDYEAFKKFQWCLFESLANLADQSQEPLFLDNKEQFSVEIRPYVSNSNSCSAQLGFVLTPRFHWSDSYVSGQFLYATSSKSSGEVSGAFTYGYFFNEKFAGSITLVGGYDWDSFHRKDARRSYRSDPKVWSIGLSPMLVYYMPTKVPLDLFLGGDVYYSQRLSLDENSDGWIYPYAESNNVLWRVKFGPSYTMKREGKSRLYQLRTSIAANVQSEIPDRFTAAPSVLFESQPLEGRGGYLFKLGFDLGSEKKSWQFAYGLRF